MNSPDMLAAIAAAIMNHEEHDVPGSSPRLNPITLKDAHVVPATLIACIAERRFSDSTPSLQQVVYFLVDADGYVDRASVHDIGDSPLLGFQLCEDCNDIFPSSKLLPYDKTRYCRECLIWKVVQGEEIWKDNSLRNHYVEKLQLYCCCMVDGQVVESKAAAERQLQGDLVDWWVPCAKDVHFKSHVYPDYNRATHVILAEFRKHVPPKEEAAQSGCAEGESTAASD